MLVDVQQKALQDAITAVPQLPEAIVLLKVTHYYSLCLAVTALFC
jgi:hypothetical protein